MPAWSLPWDQHAATRNVQLLHREKEHLLEDQDESSDGTDSFTEIPLVDEKIISSHRWWNRKKILAGLQFVLVAAVTAANITLVVMIWTGRLKIISIDQNALPPEMSVDTPQVFTSDHKFTIYSEDHGVAAWQKETQNVDLGKAYVSDPSEHSLFLSELPSDIPGYEMYPVALYHQIHCLGTIRDEFYKLNISEDIAYGNHVGHCFDYLRLSLLCAGDLTLEYTGHGMDVEHLCKDPKEVEGFMKRYNTDVRALVAVQN